MASQRRASVGDVDNTLVPIIVPLLPGSWCPACIPRATVDDRAWKRERGCRFITTQDTIQHATNAIRTQQDLPEPKRTQHETLSNLPRFTVVWETPFQQHLWRPTPWNYYARAQKATAILSRAAILVVANAR
mmetsp:Transcript_14497/g.39962  ORF Transcript_14497/g.39962 Transcript_14497/m.39962 type:complete len:132 (-) Transcript_14497:651-1046(-)